MPLAYKATCFFDTCEYEKVTDDFDRLVDELTLHYLRIHKLKKPKKWAGEWQIVALEPPKGKNKKAVK